METTNTNDKNVLDCPLRELNLTEYFVNKSADMGYSTIREITNCGPGNLATKKGFCYTWYNELVRFLKGIGQLHLLEEQC